MSNLHDGKTHASDCAVNNEPAYPAGPCDCGAKVKVDMRNSPVLRGTLLGFAEEMERQLRRHETSPHVVEKDNEGWINCSLSYLLDNLERQYVKVENGVNNFLLTASSASDIVRHAAHLANYAMMIADVAQRRACPTLEFKERHGALIRIAGHDDGLWLEIEAPSGTRHACSLDSVSVNTSIGKMVVDELRNIMRDEGKR